MAQSPAHQARALAVNSRELVRTPARRSSASDDAPAWAPSRTPCRPGSARSAEASRRAAPPLRSEWRQRMPAGYPHRRCHNHVEADNASSTSAGTPSSTLALHTLAHHPHPPSVGSARARTRRARAARTPPHRRGGRQTRPPPASLATAAARRSAAPPPLAWGPPHARKRVRSRVFAGAISCPIAARAIKLDGVNSRESRSGV